MFDALHTSGNGPLNRRWRKGVHGDVSTPIIGRFNSRPQFRLRESRHVDRAERRGNTAASRQFDLGGALHELLTDADAHLVGAVGDHAAANLFHAAEHAADRPRQFGQLAEIPVSAGYRDESP
jgi:hypothetical protein